MATSSDDPASACGMAGLGCMWSAPQTISAAICGGAPGTSRQVAFPARRGRAHPVLPVPRSAAIGQANRTRMSPNGPKSETATVSGPGTGSTPVQDPVVTNWPAVMPRPRPERWLASQRTASTG